MSIELNDVKITFVEIKIVTETMNEIQFENAFTNNPVSSL